jgi:hypothetical protein
MTYQRSVILAFALGVWACGGVNEIDDSVCEEGVIECGDDCCSADEACTNNACVSISELAVAEFASTPLDPTGWVTANDAPIEFTAVTVDLPGVIYECRTGPAMMIGDIAFAPCDGGDGTTPVHQPVPNPAMEEGSYRTELRVVVDDFVSEPAGFDFYAHRSLDAAPICDPPALSDDAIFTAAAAELLAGVPPTVPAAISTRNPFVSVPFVNVQPSFGAAQSLPWSNVVGQDFTVEAPSLRRRFALSTNQQMMLVQRRYGSRQLIALGETDGNRLCENRLSIARVGGDCPNFVINARGKSVCVDDSGNVDRTTDNGFIKLQKMVSPKGASETCPPNQFAPGACAFYLALPM